MPQGDKIMTNAQQLAKQMMTKKATIDWEALKFKIENDKTYYFRFVPDANPDNPLFFQNFKTYKLSDTAYINYPTGYNNIQKTLNALWATGGSAEKAIYTSLKGKESHNVGIVLCNESGDIIDPKVKIWSITAKKLWESIMEVYFDKEFIETPNIYFSVKRTGLKLDTVYELHPKKGMLIDFDKIELVKLDLPLAFGKADSKAIPHLMKLIKKFDLDVQLHSPIVADEDDLDEFEATLIKEIEGE